MKCRCLSRLNMCTYCYKYFKNNSLLYYFNRKEKKEEKARVQEKMEQLLEMVELEKEGLRPEWIVSNYKINQLYFYLDLLVKRFYCCNMWQYPLKDWKTLKRGSVPFGTRYPKTKAMGELGGQIHVGTDVLIAQLNPIFAPCDTFVRTQVGKEGGNTLLFIDPQFGYLHRMMHLSKFAKKGDVKAGDIIGYTGMTGKTTAPHVHYDISKSGKLELGNFNNFLDPEAFYKSLLIEEIKKNMKILLAINESVTVNEGALRGILEYVKDYWKVAELQFSTKTVHYGGYNFPWTGTENTERQITREWTAFNLVPYASQFDAVVFWMTPDEWKSPKTQAYSVREQILGVHVIALACSLDQEDTTFNTPQNNLFAALLRHELSHMFIQRTKSYCPLNTTKEYRKDYDNTHYFEYVVKDLKQMTKDIDLTNFVGWIPREGKRMFKYNGTSKLKWPFSGAIVPKKVFRSTDNRMFFCCAPNDRDLWSILTENQYNDAISKGAMSGIMSVPEANWIYYDLGQPLPPSKPKSIKMEIATTKSQELWLRLQGYDFIIPTSHLSN